MQIYISLYKVIYIYIYILYIYIKKFSREVKYKGQKSLTEEAIK